jgi:nucleoside-diphosphate kinase
VLELSKIGAIEQLRTLAGPEDSFYAKRIAPNSIRAQFGSDQIRNAFHASADGKAASREIKMCFPDSAGTKLIKKLPATRYLNVTVMPAINEALTALSQVNC